MAASAAKAIGLTHVETEIVRGQTSDAKVTDLTFDAKVIAPRFAEKENVTGLPLIVAKEIGKVVLIDRARLKGKSLVAKAINAKRRSNH